MESLKVKRVSVLLREGTDLVWMVLDEVSSPFPEMDAAEPGKYGATAQIDVRHDYGIEWVRKTFGREPDEVISSRILKVPLRRVTEEFHDVPANDGGKP